MNHLLPYLARIITPVLFWQALLLCSINLDLPGRESLDLSNLAPSFAIYRRCSWNFGGS